MKHVRSILVEITLRDKTDKGEISTRYAAIATVGPAGLADAIEVASSVVVDALLRDHGEEPIQS